MPLQDDISKFKKLISKLPENKKKLLYKRLQAMPPTQREAFISDYIKKYYVEEKKPAGKKNIFQSIILGFLIAFFIIGLCYFIYVFNKQKLDNKFNEMLGMPEETAVTDVEDSGIEASDVKHFPTDTPTPQPATPTPTPVPVADDHPDLSGLVIVIDPGHQMEPDSELEEAIPGTSAEKERATSGSTGVNSGTKEYELTLEYAMVLKSYLEGCGAEVILTRTENDVNISNIERAQIAVDNEADYFIRIHADSAPDSDISGVKVYVPSTGEYSSSIRSDGEELADTVADAIGSESLGVVQSDMYTGLNHADSVKSFQLVVGYFSNSDDDALLNKKDTPYKVAVAVSEFLGE